MHGPGALRAMKTTTCLWLAASVGTRRDRRCWPRRPPPGQGRWAPTAAAAAAAFAPSSAARNRRPLPRGARSCSLHLNSASAPDSEASSSTLSHRPSDGRTVHGRTDAPFFPRSIDERVEGLTSHPAVVWDESSTFASMCKKKLGRRHLPLFERDGDASHPHRDRLFDEFAMAVCGAGVVARKEAFETWAAALYVHASFFGSGGGGTNGEAPRRRRVADVAAGHGLLAWALLILDDDAQRRRNREQPSQTPLTAFCLDVQMPKSAEKIQSSMVRRFPRLEGRFDYVEGRLEQLVPHPSCVLASVHACGILSDVLVATAAEYGVPLAVVPCCHSRKRKVLEVASPYARELYEEIILHGEGGMHDLAERLDEARVVALMNSGMDVGDAFLPRMFTGKNRLIMGIPGDEPAKVPDNPAKRRIMPLRKGQMPPLDDPQSGILPKRTFLKGFYVPCEDTEDNRRLVNELAGRAAADGRKEAMRNRRHEASPRLDLSLWLPDDDSNLSEEALSRIVESRHDVVCTVSKIGSVYVNPAGRRARTFRVRYGARDGAAVRFEDAKRMHGELCEAIPSAFPGADCR